MNNTTELVFILDRSGSMFGLENDTIGGFNSMLEKQKQEEGAAYVTTVLFNSHTQLLHDRVKLEAVPPLTREDYVPGGCTALLDAVGQTIRHIVTIHRYARPEDVPARTVFVITTDGLENASHRFRLDEVKRMIEHEQEKYGWEFLFLGANIDAVGTAGDLGIRPDRSANFHADSQGVEMSFRSLNCALSQARKGAPLPSTWKDDVDNDYVNRK